MNAKTPMKALAAAVLAALVPPAFAADEAPGQGLQISGEVTPKLFLFDYFKGYGEERTQFLERYGGQKASDGDLRSGAYADVDLSLRAEDGRREVFALERQGFGVFNHRGFLKANSDKLGLAAAYTRFRTSTGGIEYLYSPNQVPGGTEPSYFFPAQTNTNSGFAAQFNEDTGGKQRYSVDRTTYGLGLALKPALFNTSFTGSVDFDGYQREGNRFATFVLGGSDVTGAAQRVLQRWRGLDMPVDERMNRTSLKLSGAPGGYTLSYEGAFEKFDSRARNYTVADLVPFMAGFGVSSNKPIHFVPDSNFVSNKLRLAKRFGTTTVAAGYGLSVLEQDSFAARQEAFGFTTGKITSNSAYLNVNSGAIAGIGLEGYVKYSDRNNDSTFPAVGLIDPAVAEQLGVRVDKLANLGAGLAVSWRAKALKSNLTAGWKHEDVDRDLTFHEISLAPAINGIAAVRSTYRDATKSDELYLKVISRPAAGVTVRLTPFYQWADETGLVTEPERSAGLRAKLSYAVSNAVLVSGHYDYRNRKNADHTLSGNAAGSLEPLGTVSQDAKRTQQAAGLSLALQPSEWVSGNVGLYWNRDDAKAWFLRSDRRRFEAPAAALQFLQVDRPNYDIDTYVFTAGGDWQVTDALRWSGGYSYAQSKGSTASGYVGDVLTVVAGSVDGRIDNSLHTLTLGGEYAMKTTFKLLGSYTYEKYNDRVYDALTGGYHTVMVGLAVGL